MFTGLQGQKILYTKQHHLWERYAEKIMVSIRAKLLECWADSVWPCIFHFPLCTKKVYKFHLKIKLWISLIKAAWSPRVNHFPPLTLSFRLVPIWSTEIYHVYLFAWVSKTWTGRRPAPSLPQETRSAPVASRRRCKSLVLRLYWFSV